MDVSGKFLILSLVLLIILLIVWSILKYWNPSWRVGPLHAFREFVEKFGPPSTIDRKHGGLAIWNNKQLKPPYHTLIVKDEEIPHCCPTVHQDFVYTAVVINISDPLQLLIVLSLSKSVWYDQTAKLLWVRCNSLGANLATLVYLTNLLLLPQDQLVQKYVSGLSQDYINIVSSISKNNYNNYLHTLVLNLGRIKYNPPMDCDKIVNCDNLLDHSSFGSLLAKYPQLVTKTTVAQASKYQLGSLGEYGVTVPNKECQPHQQGSFRWWE